MRVLLLGEGNAEARDSWSGSSKSIVDALRACGETVIPADVDLYGAKRVLVAAMTYAPDRERWRMRFRLGGIPYRFRSSNAADRIVRAEPPIDIILQIGATFEPSRHGAVPYALICDSNIELARHGAATGYSEAASLTTSELRDIKAREAAIYSQASVIFTLSERTRRSFIEDFGVPPDRVRAVYAGPNFDPEALRLPTRVSASRPPTVLFVGRQFERKGGDTLLAAFRKVRHEIEDAQLVIVGPDHLDVDDAGVVSRGFIDKSTPTGWESLIQLYASADVFCLPTRFEAFGVAYIEAMHFGLPCIGTNVWAVPEIVADRQTGYLISPNDVDALADRLILLLRDRHVARQMGEAGRDRARELFTWRHTAERMIESLTRVVSSSSSVTRAAPTPA